MVRSMCEPGTTVFPKNENCTLFLDFLYLEELFILLGNWAFPLSRGRNIVSKPTQDIL